MKYILILLTLLFAFPASSQDKEESAYERVMKTNTLRCGYGYWEPGYVRNEATGEDYGIFVDLMDALGKISGLKVKWVEQVDYGQIPQALQSGKIDAMCSGIWPSSKRGRQILYTDPFFYLTVEPFVRADDNRFSEGLSSLNREDIRLGVIDNDIGDEIADFNFPNAQKVSLPLLSNASEKFLMLVTNKADVIFTTNTLAVGFNRKNPEKIKRLALRPPLRIYDDSIAVDIHEHELAAVLNTAIRELDQSGVTDSILNRYENDYPNSFLRVTKPYEVPR